MTSNLFNGRSPTCYAINYSQQLDRRFCSGLSSVPRGAIVHAGVMDPHVSKVPSVLPFEIQIVKTASISIWFGDIAIASALESSSHPAPTTLLESLAVRCTANCVKIWHEISPAEEMLDQKDGGSTATPRG